MPGGRTRGGGGLNSILYSFRKAREAGGLFRFYRRMRARNACKTCALGMSGMRDEAGSFPEVCKKSFQAQSSDMQKPIAEAFFSDRPFDALEAMSPRELEAAGRVGFSLIAAPGDDRFRRLSWDEAFDRIADQMKSIRPDEAFFYCSGRSSNEAAFILQWVARAWGTNNVNSCAYYCHSASGVGLTRSIGSGTGTITLEDIGRADLAFVIGANPASNHPRMMTKLVKLRRRGGKIIVVNPMREAGLVRFRIPSDVKSMLLGSDVSDIYVRPHIGGDIPFLKGVAKGVLENGAVEPSFIKSHTVGWRDFEEDLKSTPWEAILANSGVDKDTIDEVAELYSRSKNTIFFWAMGITQHLHGVQNVLSIANLALLRGMIGRPGAGLMPIRGHSNVQGVGSCGVTPALKRSFAEAMEQHYAMAIPDRPGLHTFDCMTAAMEGDLKVGFLLGGNLLAANPARRFASGALRSLDLTVSVTTTLNEGHIHGRGKTAIILPARTRDEEEQETTQESMFNYVRLSEGGAKPLSSEIRSEVAIITTLAEKLIPGGPFDWKRMKSHHEIRTEIARVVPGYEEIGRIDETREDFRIDGRIRHEPEFPTESGKAAFIVTPIPVLGGPNGRLRLMTIRSEGQFNTVVYEEEDIYRGQERRDVILMNEEDARERRLEEDTPVTVRSEAGSLGPVLVRFADIRRGGAAMYFPEANALVSRAIDPASGTPAFKSTWITLEAP